MNSADLATLGYRIRGGLLTAAHRALLQYRRRYEGIPTVHNRPLPGSQPEAFEGYTEQQWYRAGDEVVFFLRAPDGQHELLIQRVTGPESVVEVARHTFVGQRQTEVAERTCEEGCNWEPTLKVSLTPQLFPTGYYRALIVSHSGAMSLPITFLVQNDDIVREAPIAVIAPTATWTAYNPYGGKSLYHNEIDGGSVYFASTQRPNPALSYDPSAYLHSMRTEAGAFAWLDASFGADLFPDFALASPELFEKYRAIVLLYHAEYIDDDSYRGLRQLVHDEGKSLLSLGANQIYWKVRWHDDHRVIECRKDATRFSDGSSHGGLWRHTSHPEDELLGCRFTIPGTGTYAPYRVTAPDHWLFEGTGVREGELFGEMGSTNYPICGDETDKPTGLSRLRSEIVARGLNRSDQDEDAYTVYDTADAAWDGSGGGVIALTPISTRHAVLATGSIHSGSGLGYDRVFTRLITNFLSRYTSSP